MAWCVAAGLVTGGGLAACGSSSDGGGTAPGAPEQPPHHLGAMHQHSAFSDGHPLAIPADYFRQARERGLAFNASAEHSDFLFLPVVPLFECLIPSEPSLLECLTDRLTNADRVSLFKWRDTLEQARGESREHFVGIRGFEWTNPRHGHINVYFSQHYASALLDGGILTMQAFWSWFTRSPSLLGGADGIMTFNHPGREDTFADFDPGFTFNGMEYVPEAAARMVGVEVFNRGNRRDFVEWWVRALDQGWHAAPIGSEDHHGLDWGALDLAKTSIVTDDLSEAGLRAAFLQRRFYALLDNDAESLADYACIVLSADGAPMGSELLRADGERVTLEGAVFMRDTTGACTAQPFAGRVELVTTGDAEGVVVADQRTDAGTLRWETTAGEHAVGPYAQSWYFLRVRRDDDTIVGYSAPVWIGPQPSSRTTGE